MREAVLRQVVAGPAGWGPWHQTAARLLTVRRKLNPRHALSGCQSCLQHLLCSVSRLARHIWSDTACTGILLSDVLQRVVGGVMCRRSQPALSTVCSPKCSSRARESPSNSSHICLPFLPAADIFLPTRNFCSSSLELLSKTSTCALGCQPLGVSSRERVNTIALQYVHIP